MILYPAIDLKDGKCVRLLQGDMDKATVLIIAPPNKLWRFGMQGCSGYMSLI